MQQVKSALEHLQAAMTAHLKPKLSMLHRFGGEINIVASVAIQRSLYTSDLAASPFVWACHTPRVLRYILVVLLSVVVTAYTRRLRQPRHAGLPCPVVYASEDISQADAQRRLGRGTCSFACGSGPG